MLNIKFSPDIFYYRISESHPSVANHNSCFHAATSSSSLFCEIKIAKIEKNRTTMRLSLLLLSFVGFCSAQPRSTLNVGFEYQLEVEDVQSTGSTTDALEIVDGTILDRLQKNFPQKDDTGAFLVEFNTIESQIFSACFTDNDQCSLVRSSIEVVYDAGKPEHSVEFVTLQLVQDFLASISMGKKGVFASYAYPSMVSSLAQFQMNIVMDRMTDTEIKVLEATFAEVFGAIVFAMEGDTEVVDVKFLFQDLLGSFAQTLSAELRIAGYCRDCTMAQFEQIVVDTINGNLPAFQTKLKVNSNALNSTYFDRVSSITFSVPELPETLAPIGDASIFDETPPTVENKLPWFLWFGVALAILVICCGCYMIFRENAEYEKEDFSTSEEGSQAYDSQFASGDEEDGTFEEEGTDLDLESVEQTEAQEY